MSGPKCSIYTLTEQQKKALEEQREQERKLKEDKLLISKNVKKLSDMRNKFDDSLEQANELHLRFGNTQSFTNKVDKMKSVIDKCISTANKTDSTPAQISEKRENLDNSTLEIDKMFSDLKKESVSVNGLYRESMLSDVDKGFKAKANANIDKKSELHILAEEIISKLNGLLIDNITSEFKSKVLESIKTAKEIDSLEFLQNFNSLSVIPLIKECNKYTKIYNENIDYFNKLQVKYQVLCDILLIPFTAQEFSIHEIIELEVKIQKHEQELAFANEQGYIADAIDEVMVEMGYDVLGHKEVTKRNGKHFKSELFKFDEGTAVNVTYSADGKIAMELGGISNTDREPTTDEKRKLCSDMESFCGDFAVIEKRLVEKGVIVKNRISILPPNEEYAQIISTEEYNLKEQVKSISETSTKRKIKKAKFSRME